MPPDAVSLLHLVGFLTGIVLYAMLAAMCVRTLPVRALANGHADRIPIVTAVLGLVWNSGALVIYGFQDFGMRAPSPWLGAIAFSALGFLPAVVVHSALQAGDWRRATRLLTAATYTLSGIASAMQFGTALRGTPTPSRPALITLTVGYGIIMALLVLNARRQPGWRRALPVVALAVFAVMAFHLSQHTAASDTLPVELVGHHASIPLALVILYQDYRFALVDLFLKRALTLLALILLAVAFYATMAVPFILPHLVHDFTSPRAVSALLALWIATALAYPLLRRGIARFVDRIVLRRTDYRSLRADLSARMAAFDSEGEVLNAACAALAVALSSGQVTWTSLESDALAPNGLPSRNGATRVIVPTTEAPAYVMTVADLSGGRRMLSDDVALLESAAIITARRVDSLRVSRERHARDLREREMAQLATEAELRALRAQLNPHFLFNALATIGYLMREAPERALDTLYRLTSLLRAVLRPVTGELVTLREEMDIVESYLGIERARFEERLHVAIMVPDELYAARIPALLLQPLVENAITHGIAPLGVGGSVRVEASVEPGAAMRTPVLCLCVADTGAGASPRTFAQGRAGRVGLGNIEQRLERFYGQDASLSIDSQPGRGTTAVVRLPFRVSTGRPVELAS